MKKVKSSPYLPLKKSPSTAILCVARNEHPYIAEWLEYHFKLGIDRIYFVSTDDDFPAVINLMIANKYLSQVELLCYHRFQQGWQMACYSEFRGLIKEDWVLVLDLDEFLYLQPEMLIQDFLDGIEQSVHQIQFPWLLQLSQGYFERSVFDILKTSESHVSNHVKSMVRTASATALGIHSHRAPGGNILSSGQEVEVGPIHERLFFEPDFTASNPFILHFFSRGYFDSLNRIISHRFFNGINGSSEKQKVVSFLNEEASYKHIPARMLLSLIYEQMPVVNNPLINVPSLESLIDLDLVRNIFLDNLKSVVEVESFAIGELAEEFEEKFRVSQKMSQLKLSGAFDLNTYREFDSQLGYVNKLRSQLLKIHDNND
ncbi:MAG: hypothetical protein ACI8P9_001996 [Parasphingorhabdus sp.]|jgi:hypothetical protein